MRYSPNAIRQALLASIENNRPLIGVAVGSGLSAKQAEAGGADFLLALNAGRFRMAGISSLAGMMPYGNSNELVMDFGVREILPRVKVKPVLFGVCATDPTINPEELLRRIISAGFDGVNNFPTVGLIDGILRQSLEESDLGYQKEVDFLTKASAKGLFTLAFVFDPEQAHAMAKIPVDVICAHLGFTVGGKLGAKQGMSLDEGVRLAASIFTASDQINPSIIKMVYGGPITDPTHADYFYRNTQAQGFIGGSTFERIPAEATIEEATIQFKKVARLSEENASLRKELLKKKGFDDIVGQSRIMQELYEIVRKVASKDISVLVSGESGTGKELVVKAIHSNSARANQPFIKVNCAAIPETLLESELFGHEKGAFTGATGLRLGLFEMADKGTLFLDEIGDMSACTQAKLLRAIQQQEFQRVGGTKVIKVDIRIVSATNVNFHEAVSQGRFREDLYYRINVVSVRTPPLRQHKEDIPLLINYFLKEIERKFHRSIRRLSPAVLEIFMQYNWPGNVRELQHTLESAAILCDGDVIGIEDLPATFLPLGDFTDQREQGGMLSVANRTTAILEKQWIVEALDKLNWSRIKTAEHLGITRRTLLNKMKKYRIIKSG